MSRPSHRRPHPALLRARYRILFFLVLTLFALASGHRAAAAPALAGVLLGACSIRIARRRPEELALTFVVLDWACLGLALAISGGMESWLLLTIPFLAMGQLASVRRGEALFITGSPLLLLVILAIADPALGGNRAAGVLKVAVLVAGGCIGAGRIRRRPASAHRPPARAPKVDVGTGLSTGACLPAFLDHTTAAALAGHRPLSVIYVRLEHYEDSRGFLGAKASEELVRGVARRVERRAGADGRAFRVQPDGIVLALPDTSLIEARKTASELAREVSAGLIGGRRQTLVTGVSSFPAIRRVEDLLAAAYDEARPRPVSADVVGTVVPLAAVQ